MYYYKANIQYDGTDYFGFQWQKDIVSVQNDFNLALQKCIPGKITTMSASRTDTGVHALDQVVRVTSENPISVENFPEVLNRLLPPQIRCLKFSECEKTFSPNNDSVSKEYRYLFTNLLKQDCSERRIIANNPFSLDVEAMKICVKAIPGLHDFKNFCSAGSNVKTTIRDISFCDLSVVNPKEVLASSNLFHTDLENCYQLRIVGKGFLKQMVRHLMSSLWLVGNGRLSTEEFINLLEGPKKEQRLWKVANAKGLFLYKIIY